MDAGTIKDPVQQITTISEGELSAIIDTDQENEVS